MHNENGFIIENGILKDYVGTGGDITVPDQVTSIGLDAFKMCKTLGFVHLPQSVKFIGNYAFFGSSITGIHLPEGVELGNAAFESCASLKEIRIPAGTEIISAGVFSNCEGLESITFPDSLVTIENAAFEGCSRLKALQLPENLEEIGGQCFDRCKKLEQITFPESLKYIGGGAFARCGNLKHIDCSTRVFRLFLDACNAKNLLAVTYDYLAGNLVTTAKPDEQFAKYVKKNIAKLFPLALADDCPEAMETISTISGAIDQKVLDSMIEVSAADQKAPKVTAWLLRHKSQTADPAQAAAAEKDRLDKALGLKQMTAADWKKIYAVKAVDADQLQLGKYSGTDIIVTVPDMIGKKKVTILAGTFFNYDRLQEVDLPDTITELFMSTFGGCRHLAAIKLPKKLKVLGGGVFENCSALTQIELPKSVSMLGMGTFENCTALNKVTLSPKIKKICMNAFAGCTALTEITLPEKCREIEFFAFARCRNLQSVHIGMEVKSIDSEAFDNCPNITIYAPVGSYAEAWAKEHNIPFVGE